MKNIWVSLGGGADRISFTVGFLAGLFEWLARHAGKYRLQLICGTSEGGLCAAAVGQGKFNKLQNIVRTIKKGDIMKTHVGGGILKYARFIGWAKQFIRGDKLSWWDRSLYDQLVDDILGSDNYKIPTYVAYVDLNMDPPTLCFPSLQESIEMYGHEWARNEVKATGIMPGTWDPIQIGNRRGVDGGLRDIVPLRPMIDLTKTLGAKPDVVISVPTHPLNVKPKRVTFDSWKKPTSYVGKIITAFTSEITENDLNTPLGSVRHLCGAPKYEISAGMEFNRAEMDAAEKHGLERAKEVMSELG